MSNLSPYIMVIDPGVHTPEIDTYNLIANLSPIPCTYHLPALFGFKSFPNDLKSVRGVIILGSAASVHDQLPWQQPLEDWLRPVISRSIPILGCCYGHQMLVHMLGGRVEYINAERSKLKGVRRVEILENSLWSAGTRDLIVTHCEAVTSLPAQTRILAKSAEIEIDGFMHENKPLFGLQSHIEATKVFLEGHEMLDAQTLQALPDGTKLLYQFVHMAAKYSA